MLLSCKVSSQPIASASATLHSASFFACDFLHSLHFPTGHFPPFFTIISSHTDSHSLKTALRPFTFPHKTGSGWLVEYVMVCGWPRVSGCPGLGRGLLSGIMVSWRCCCPPPGFESILLMLKASCASPSCADKQSKRKILIWSGCDHLKILIAWTICSISCLRSHQSSNTLPG